MGNTYFEANKQGFPLSGEREGGCWIGGDAYTAVAVAKKVGTGSWTVYNIFRDHLGSITHLKTGSTVTEYSYEAWGRRRDKDDWTTTLTSEPALFADRGFTGHEYLEDFKLYNMNGRLYDPVVGRFLSADPFIQDPGFTQSLNRYSYCLNNPLKYTVPSGEVIPWLYFAGQLLGNYLFGVADNTINKKMPLNQAAKQFNVGVSYNPSTNHFFIPGVDAQYTAWKQTAVTNTANELVSTRAIYGDEWHTAGQGGDLATASFITGAASLGYDSWQNLAYDGYNYIPTKGPNAGQPTSVWKMNKSGNFAMRNGSKIPNSANAASKLMVTSMVKIGGIALTTVGVGFTVYDIRQNGLNLSNGTDFVMGSVAYVPGWGWAVSGGYFIGKACYEVYPSIPADYWGRPGTGFSR